MRQQLCVRSRDVDVVLLDRNGGEHLGDVRLSRRAPAAVGQLDADQELRSGDRCDRDVVVVPDQVVEPSVVALGIYERGRVENQSSQRRSSSVVASRARRTSASQPASRGAPRRRSLTSLP